MEGLNLKNLKSEMEEWRTIPSFENYEISSLRRVRRSKTGPGSQAGYVLKLTESFTGHLEVVLRRNNHKHRCRVETVFREAFGDS